MMTQQIRKIRELEKRDGPNTNRLVANKPSRETLGSQAPSFATDSKFCNKCGAKQEWAGK